MSSLSKGQRQALSTLASCDRLGPRPDSQTDGNSITADTRRTLLNAGYVETREVDFDPGADQFYRDGSNTRIAAKDISFIPTHWWTITPAGRAALQDAEHD